MGFFFIHVVLSFGHTAPFNRRSSCDRVCILENSGFNAFPLVKPLGVHLIDADAIVKDLYRLHGPCMEDERPHPHPGVFPELQPLDGGSGCHTAFGLSSTTCSQPPRHGGTLRVVWPLAYIAKS